MDHTINISLITNQITNNRKKINNIDEYNNEKKRLNFCINGVDVFILFKDTRL